MIDPLIPEELHEIICALQHWDEALTDAQEHAPGPEFRDLQHRRMVVTTLLGEAILQRNQLLAAQELPVAPPESKAPQFQLCASCQALVPPKQAIATVKTTKRVLCGPCYRVSQGAPIRRG